MFLFFIFYFTIGKTIYNYDDFDYYSTIFLESLDVAEIKVSKGYGTFLGKWEQEDLYIFVDAESKYGPYDYDSGLCGIIFNSYDYIVRFVNNGLDVINISFEFSKRVPGYGNKTLGIHWIMQPYDSINNLTSPLIFFYDNESLNLIMIIMAVLFGVVMFIPCWRVSCKK